MMKIKEKLLKNRPNKRWRQSIDHLIVIKASRDGADILNNIEKLSFADVAGVDITLDNPMPVNDVVTIADRTGLKLLKVADILANDRDWQNDSLKITTISDIVGGSIVGSYNATTKEWRIAA